MTSFPRFSAKLLLADRLDLVSSVLVFTNNFRLQLDPASLNTAVDIPLSDLDDPVVCFDVLLLWQFGFLMLETHGLPAADNYLVSIHPFGIQPFLFGEETSLVASFLNPIEFSLRVPTGDEPPAIAYFLPELVQGLVDSTALQQLLLLSSLPCAQTLVAPLLALNSCNRLAYLSKYAFCRSSSFNGALERRLDASVPILSNPALKSIPNISPTLRRGELAPLSSVQDLVRLVFRKAIRGLIAVDPPLSTFSRSTPSPGGLAACEAFVLHGISGSTTSLLYYDSEHDSFIDCCVESSTALQKLANHVHREAMLNYQSDDWAGTVLIFTSDLWSLERKYGAGAFSLACLEVGVLAEAVHNQLSSFQLAGCLCGSLQAWPLLALAHPSRHLLPMIGYSLMKL